MRPFVSRPIRTYAERYPGAVARWLTVVLKPQDTVDLVPMVNVRLRREAHAPSTRTSPAPMPFAHGGSHMIAACPMSGGRRDFALHSPF